MCFRQGGSAGRLIAALDGSANLSSFAERRVSQPVKHPTSIVAEWRLYLSSHTCCILPLRALLRAAVLHTVRQTRKLKKMYVYWRPGIYSTSVCLSCCDSSLLLCCNISGLFKPPALCPTANVGPSVHCYLITMFVPQTKAKLALNPAFICFGSAFISLKRPSTQNRTTGRERSGLMGRWMWSFPFIRLSRRHFL